MGIIEEIIGRSKNDIEKKQKSTYKRLRDVDKIGENLIQFGCNTEFGDAPSIAVYRSKRRFKRSMMHVDDIIETGYTVNTNV